ncbi:Sister chromatid cohesion protein PDS5 -like protein BAlike, partial [Caligus rogercresseyi]
CDPSFENLICAMSSNHKDVITIVYPPGCREVSDDLGSDELIRRLKTLVTTFQNYSQAEDESSYAELVPLSNHLVDESFLNHESKDVQLLWPAASIPNQSHLSLPHQAAGGDQGSKESSIQAILLLTGKPGFCQSFTMCFDLEDSSEILCSLFSLFFRI